MSVKSRQFVRAAIVLSGLGFAGGALAQGAGSDVADARLRWADRHEQLVCEPLAAQGRAAAARRCMQRVSEVRGSALRSADATASLPEAPGAILPPAREEVSPFINKRCSGMACIKQFTSLGVGF